MPTLLTGAPQDIPSLAPPRKRWTREECAPLEASGLFEKERLELIDGDLISKTGKNRPHVNASMLMLEWLQETFGKRFVNAEAPIDVNPGDNPLNEPVPDLIVLKREYSTFTILGVGCRRPLPLRPSQPGFGHVLGYSEIQLRRTNRPARRAFGPISARFEPSQKPLPARGCSAAFTRASL
jgi:hypothetical protein